MLLKGKGNGRRDGARAAEERIRRGWGRFRGLSDEREKRGEGELFSVDESVESLYDLLRLNLNKRWPPSGLLMRRLTLAFPLLCLCVALTPADSPKDQPLVWRGDVEDARKEALKTGKPLLVTFR
jgi:hypothetical protein